MPLARPYILLISGPAAAGKSTIARHWASTRGYPCAHLSLDEIRQSIKSGFADPAFGWTPETRRQFLAARRSVAFAARQFLDIGVSCVIDDVVFPEWKECDYAGWVSDFGGVKPDMVILLPKLEVALEWNSGRDEAKRLPDDMVKTIHAMMEPWRAQSCFPVIDNSGMTIDEAVAAIKARLETEA